MSFQPSQGICSGWAAWRPRSCSRARRRSTAGDSSALRGSPNGGFLFAPPGPGRARGAVAPQFRLSRRHRIGPRCTTRQRGRGHMVAAAPFAWPMAGSTRDRMPLGNREQTPSLAAGSGLNTARAGPSPGAGHPGPRTRKRRALFLCPIVSLSPPGRRFSAVRGSKSAFRLRYYRIPLIKCPGGPTSPRS
jgi:hypothetical protein